MAVYLLFSPLFARPCNRLPSKSRQCFSRFFSSNIEPQHVVITGGGMVGTAMACALAHDPKFAKKKITLLESGPEKVFDLPPTYKNRVSTINPASAALLESFGAWSKVLQMRCQPVKRMQVWESCSDSLLTFNQPDLSLELAHVVENDVLLSSLTDSLKECPQVEVLYGTKVKNIDIPKVNDFSDKDSLVDISLESGRILRTHLLIGADGFNSVVRKTCNFPTVGWDYNQAGVVATLQLSGETENTVAWQRFLPSGPIAMLPLTNNLSSMVWSTSPSHAKELVAMSEEDFVDAVNDAFWHDDKKDPIAQNMGKSLEMFLDRIVPGGTSMRQLPPTISGVDEGSRAKFPLGLNLSSHYIRQRVALIGDAAHRIHPLAGQGVNLGFADVICLHKVLAQAVSEGADFGSLNILLPYETERLRQIVPIAVAIDGLQKLYGTNWTPAVVLRSLGLQATNAATFIKDKLIQKASNS